MKRPISIIAGLALAACSSIESAREPKAEFEGLSYYMPNKDFVATITIKAKEPAKVTFAETAAYPDLRQRYVMRFATNLVGKNTMNITVTEKGLLSTATSDTVAGISEALKNLAASLGTARGLGRTAALPATCLAGDHVFIFDATSIGGTACGVDISIKKLEVASDGQLPVAQSPVSGIYYRQYEPYRLTATGSGTDVATILFSPSQSPTRLLPITQTLFANSHAEFAFTDGVPTKYNVNADGEAIALLKLPADVVSAYFAAVGSVLDAFKANDAKEAERLNAALKLQLAQQKYDACIAAIRANDTPTVTRLGC